MPAACAFWSACCPLTTPACTRRARRTATPHTRCAALVALLVSLRGVELAREFIDDLPGPLDVYAVDVSDSGAGWQCGFRIEHAGEVLATGRAAVLRR